MSSDYSSEEENNVSESSGEESDDSSLIESVTKEVEQLKPYLYEPLCSTHSKSCNNEGSNIEVDVVGVLNWCMCKNCKEDSRDGCTLASFSTGQLAKNFYCTQILLELHLSLIIILLVYQEVRYKHVTK